MYAQAAVKQNPRLRNGAYGIVMRGVQKCTCAGASLRSKNYTPLNCITIDTASLALFRPKPKACAMPMIRRRTISSSKNWNPDFWTVSQALTKTPMGILSVRKIRRGLNSLKPLSRFRQCRTSVPARISRDTNWMNGLPAYIKYSQSESQTQFRLPQKVDNICSIVLW